jgi:hypothetical protein
LKSRAARRGYGPVRLRERAKVLHDAAASGSEPRSKRTRAIEQSRNDRAGGGGRAEGSSEARGSALWKRKNPRPGSMAGSGSTSSPRLAAAFAACSTINERDPSSERNTNPLREARLEAAKEPSTPDQQESSARRNLPGERGLAGLLPAGRLQARNARSGKERAEASPSSRKIFLRYSESSREQLPGGSRAIASRRLGLPSCCKLTAR